MVHPRGLEPRTQWLRVICSTDWAMGAHRIWINILLIFQKSSMIFKKRYKNLKKTGSSSVCTRTEYKSTISWKTDLKKSDGAYKTNLSVNAEINLKPVPTARHSKAPSSFHYAVTSQGERSGSLQVKSGRTAPVSKSSFYTELYGVVRSCTENHPFTRYHMNCRCNDFKWETWAFPALLRYSPLSSVYLRTKLRSVPLALVLDSSQLIRTLSFFWYKFGSI